MNKSIFLASLHLNKREVKCLPSLCTHSGSPKCFCRLDKPMIHGWMNGEDCSVGHRPRRGKTTSFKWRDQGGSDSQNTPGCGLAGSPPKMLCCLAPSPGSEDRGSQTLICLEDNVQQLPSPEQNDSPRTHQSDGGC